jgi:5-methylcytosine-specific restriction endonuclease McrA
MLKTFKIKMVKAIREQVWLKYIGKQYNSKCYIRWCKNEMDVFNYHVGHNIPKSKGGTLHIENLRPICSRCNLSMSNVYSIEEWQLLGDETKPSKPWWSFFKLCGLDSQ